VKWELILDTSSPEGFCPGVSSASGDEVELKGRSALLIKLMTSSTERARHESWNKRLFEAPQSSDPQKKKEEESAGAPDSENSSESPE
jgi:hypothetical protein